MISASLIIAILASLGSAFILCAILALVWLYFHPYPRDPEPEPESQNHRGTETQSQPEPKSSPCLRVSVVNPPPPPLVQNPVNPVPNSSDTIPKINHDNTKPFLCSYHHDGAEWSVTLHARDWDDARARCNKLGYLRLDGELKAVIPVKAGWLVHLWCKLCNFFKP